MERITLERLHRDPQLLGGIHAQARRQRAEAVWRILGALFARRAGHRARQADSAAPAACH